MLAEDPGTLSGVALALLRVVVMLGLPIFALARAERGAAKWSWLALLAVVASVVMKVLPLWQHRTRIGEVTTTKFVEKVADKRATGKATAAQDAQMLIRRCVLLVVACGGLLALLTSTR